MRTAEERAAYEAAHLPVFLPPSLYAAAERQGIDMTGYRISQPIPLSSGATPSIYARTTDNASR